MLLRPVWLKPSLNIAHELVLPNGRTCFVIHPATHELAEMLVVDSTALQDENYSGVYDAEGDYIPQYCDNPDDIPQGALQANIDSPAPSPGAPGESSDNSPDSSSESDKSSDGS